jgi:hypothetical protein
MIPLKDGVFEVIKDAKMEHHWLAKKRYGQRRKDPSIMDPDPGEEPFKSQDGWRGRS